MDYGELMRRLWSHVNVGDMVTVEHADGPGSVLARWYATWLEGYAVQRGGWEVAKVRIQAIGLTPEEAILRLCHMLDGHRRHRAAEALAKGATAGHEQAGGGQGQA